MGRHLESGIRNGRSMTKQVNRRTFLQRTAVGGAAAAGLAGIRPTTGCAAEPVHADSTPAARGRGTNAPAMLLQGTASLCRPLPGRSQLGFRIGLARTRTTVYPLDSMDFVMMDLERPDGRSRHAHWCVGDLTGRMLEFLSCSDGMGGQGESRVDELFERILKQRRPSGLIGRYGVGAGGMSPATSPPEDDPLQIACIGRHNCGLLRYFELTNDARALEAAVGLGDRLWTVRDAWNKLLQPNHYPCPVTWITEFLARLYMATGEQRWLDFCGMIRDRFTSEPNGHAHFLMTTLRGLQLMALATGDRTWNEKPERIRRLIIERHFELPDGCTPESFPTSPRNEGCSIADWLMLNLNAGLLGEDTAYEKAERIFWNALAFNQWINGSFGHRELIGNGYGVRDMSEAWWCCVHHAGMAMCELARHVVTYRDGAIRVNFLMPGQYTVALPGGNSATVTIDTAYPARAEATITADHVPAGMALTVRVPACVRKPELRETRSGENLTVTLRGELGHRIEDCRPGIILTYGPLVLVPGTGLPASSSTVDPSGVPPGYVPQALPPGTASIKLGSPVGTEGYVDLPTCPGTNPLPVWSYFDEGPGAPMWVDGASVEARLKYADGAEHPTRFTPMCYNTSNLSLFDTPIMFRDVQ